MQAHTPQHRTETSCVGVYRNSFDKIGTTATLEDVIKRIKYGNRGLDEKTRYCNALAQTEPDKYKEYKASNLPAGNVRMRAVLAP